MATGDKTIIASKDYVDTGLSTKAASIDVTTALSTKQATLVSGTNIKTIAGNSVLGSGDIPASVFGGNAYYQEFTTSGTWTKPAGVNFVYVEVLGGGGGGSRASTDTGMGGAGGEFVSKVFMANSIDDEISIVVGAGGAGGVSGTNGAASGAPGGNSSFDIVAALGGNGGAPLSSLGASFARSVSATVGINPPPSPNPFTSYSGGYHTTVNFGHLGGNCIFGGGGGGGLSSTAGVGSGGVSLFAGNGGGAADASTASNGAYPAGGGGACYSATAAAQNGGNGAAGRVRVWCW